MFTIAHSLTLSLGMFGLIHLPPQVVEPLIALSIGYVAFENLASDRLRGFRLPVIFAFGLLHGLGFASVLTEFGLPADLYLAALLWFNVGVGLVRLPYKSRRTLRSLSGSLIHLSINRSIVIPGSLLIGGLGAYWTVERMVYYYFS